MAETCCLRHHRFLGKLILDNFAALTTSYWQEGFCANLTKENEGSQNKKSGKKEFPNVKKNRSNFLIYYRFCFIKKKESTDGRPLSYPEMD